MTVTKRNKYWPILFLLACLEGGIALFVLLRLPTDPTNSFLFGLSSSRLLMAATLLGAVVLFALLGYFAWRKAGWREKYLSPGKHPKLYAILNYLSFFISLFASVALFLLRYYNPERFLPFFERAKPLGLYIIVLGIQLSFWLLFLRKGFHRRKEKLTSAAIAFAILLVLFAFVAISRIGLTPDTAYWSEPGIAIQGWQFALALILGFLTLLLSFKLSLKKSDLIFALLIWAIAIAIWWSVPMDVLKSSFYAPFAYPLGKSLPYSDAGFYDYLSQGLLLGNGFLAQIPPRPLYIVFLAGLRALVGVNDYDKIMLGQTIVYALFPVVLYFLGKNLHSRAAGITVAFFGIFREWTNLLVSSQTRVSNSRTTLTDLPTALVLSLVALVVIYWLKKRSNKAIFPLISGGLFGMLLLLRTQSMLILPFILLLAILIFLPRWKDWMRLSIVFIFGVALSISPWLTRNAQLTGKITFDDPNQLAVLASQYKTSGNLNWTDFDFENESLSNSLLDFAIQNPGYVANFIATHFLATEINGLLALPLIEPFYGFQEPLNIYWTSWDGNLSLDNQLLMVFHLAIIALGIGASWKRLKWIGLVPLAFNLGYALSNGVARFSGWRYDFPADWIAYFYFGIGFVELLLILASFFNINVSKESENLGPLTKLSSSPWQLIFASFLFLSIGLSPLILEKNIPPYFESLSEEELVAKASDNSAEIELFMAEENAHALMGRLIYPRFFPRGSGIYSANPWPAYAEVDFARMGFVLINKNNRQVLFPIKHMPAEFPNGVDVILLGCQKEEYFEARLVYTMDDEKTLLSEKNLISCDE